MADTSIGGSVVVWGDDDNRKPALPVRNLEDELAGPLVFNRRQVTPTTKFVCRHCGSGTHQRSRECGRPACIRGRR